MMLAGIVLTSIAQNLIFKNYSSENHCRNNLLMTTR